MLVSLCTVDHDREKSVCGAVVELQVCLDKNIVLQVEMYMCRDTCTLKLNSTRMQYIDRGELTTCMYS